MAGGEGGGSVVMVVAAAAVVPLRSGDGVAFVESPKSLSDAEAPVAAERRVWATVEILAIPGSAENDIVSAIADFLAAIVRLPTDISCRRRRGGLSFLRRLTRIVEGLAVERLVVLVDLDPLLAVPLVAAFSR